MFSSFGFASVNVFGVMLSVVHIDLPDIVQSPDVCLFAMPLSLSIDSIIESNSIPFHFAVVSFLCSAANAVTAVYVIGP